MKTILLIILLSFIIPQIALTTWWNPLSWFDKQDIKTIVPVTDKEIIDTGTSTEQSNISLVEPEVVERVIIKTVPVEKIIDMVIEKPVVIDNPDLIKKVIDLNKEHDQLKSALNEKEQTILRLGQIVDKLNKTVLELTSSNILLQQQQENFGYSFFREIWDQGNSDLLNRLCTYIWDSNHKENINSLNKVCNDWKATFIRG